MTVCVGHELEEIGIAAEGQRVELCCGGLLLDALCAACLPPPASPPPGCSYILDVHKFERAHRGEFSDVKLVLYVQAAGLYKSYHKSSYLRDTIAQYLTF